MGRARSRAVQTQSHRTASELSFRVKEWRRWRQRSRAGSWYRFNLAEILIRHLRVIDGEFRYMGHAEVEQPSIVDDFIGALLRMHCWPTGFP